MFPVSFFLGDEGLKKGVVVCLTCRDPLPWVQTQADGKVKEEEEEVSKGGKGFSTKSGMGSTHHLVKRSNTESGMVWSKEGFNRRQRSFQFSLWSIPTGRL